MNWLSTKRKIEISPEIAGQVKKVLFEYGQSVQKGQPLYLLDDAFYQAQYKAAQSDFAYNKMTYQRLLKVANAGAISSQALAKAQTDYLDSEAKLKVIAVDLDKAEIKAPFSGVISASQVDVGQFVTTGEPLTSLVDKTDLVVRFAVPEQYFNQLALKQPVILTCDAIKSNNYHGIISYISPSIDPNSRTVMVWANIPNTHKELTPGLFVHVSANIGDKENAILIPQEALIPTVEGNDVFIIKNNKAYKKALDVGDRVGSQIIINHGLNIGDDVVIKGQEKLSAGRIVRVISK